MSRAFILILPAVWLIALIAGGFCLKRYENTPGRIIAPAAGWPADCRLPRGAHIPTLVMLAHPRCPCTRASLAELARIIARSPRALTVYVLFYKPSKSPDDWAKTTLYEQAALLPKTTALTDEDGAQARRFHALTSGQVCLYDAEGLLQFSGGITAARGQAGESAGGQAISAFLAGQRAPQNSAPVFGCSLADPATPQSAESQKTISKEIGKEDRKENRKEDRKEDRKENRKEDRKEDSDAATK